jgi:hypothetical protein
MGCALFGFAAVDQLTPWQLLFVNCSQQQTPRQPSRPIPRRDSGVVMQGQLLVFSGCMVFQSNVLGHIKFKTMCAAAEGLLDVAWSLVGTHAIHTASQDTSHAQHTQQHTHITHAAGLRTSRA